MAVTYLHSWICNTERILLVDSNIRCLKMLFLALNLIHNFLIHKMAVKNAQYALEMVVLSHLVFV